MKIYRYCFAFLLCALFQNAIAQREERSEKAVKTVINRFFEGMEKGDTALLKSTCTDHLVLQSYMADKEGKILPFFRG